MRGLYLVAEEEVVDQAIGVAAQMTPKCTRQRMASGHQKIRNAHARAKARKPGQGSSRYVGSSATRRVSVGKRVGAWEARGHNELGLDS